MVDHMSEYTLVESYIMIPKIMSELMLVTMMKIKELITWIHQGVKKIKLIKTTQRNKAEKVAVLIML